VTTLSSVSGFLADELERAGHDVGARRVWRLCSQQGLWSVTVRKGRRGAGKSPRPAVHDDHVQRNLTAKEPDRVWVTDITEHPTAEGKSTAAPSRTCSATGSSATPWTSG
jgi:putative transposase